MRAAALALVMSDGQRETLESLSRSQTLPFREVQRAKALLLAGEGVANTVIAGRVDVTVKTVRAWRERFVEEGLAKFSQVKSGRGRKPTIPQAKIDEIVDLTLHSHPEGETHWSCRTMAERTGVSSSQVQRIWSARGLKPHLVDTFKLSNDPPVRNEAGRRGGSVSEPAGAGGCAVYGREEPDPGVGPHPTVAADQARQGGHDDA